MSDDSRCTRRGLMKFAQRSLLGVALSRAAVTAQAGAPAQSHRKRELDVYIRRQMQHYKIPGASVVVVKKGSLQVSAGYGFASLEFGIPATPDSVYQIASVTKIFAGTAMMLLVQEKKADLQSPITEIFPDFPNAWNTIKVYDLLQHTSGLPMPSENPRLSQEKEKRRDRFVGEEQLDNFTADELVHFAAEMPLHFKPGTQWSYNQTGFMIVGMIVKRISGKSFPEFLDERIFRPLKMRSCRFGDSRVIVPHRPPTAYSRQSAALRNWIWPYSTTDYPAAGLNSSAADLGRFFIALQRGELLGNAALQRMWSAALLADGTTARYGLGWAVYELGGKKAVGHEGGGCCWVTHLPREQVTAIVLSNLAGARADQMSNDVAQLFL